MWQSSNRECVFAENMPCSPAGGGGLDQQHHASRSNHPGGVQVVFADGHVSFIFDTIALDVWRALGSINGEEPVNSTMYD